MDTFYGYGRLFTKDLTITNDLELNDASSNTDVT